MKLHSYDSPMPLLIPEPHLADIDVEFFQCHCCPSCAMRGCGVICVDLTMWMSGLVVCL